jgi:hypothetical protein
MFNLNKLTSLPYGIIYNKGTTIWKSMEEFRQKQIHDKTSLFEELILLSGRKIVITYVPRKIRRKCG